MQPNGWTLIGALMVMLHAHDHGLDARRTTRDADALVDVRGIAQATRRLVTTLEHLGWQLHPDHPKADDIGFRFAKDGLLFDVLAPDGLGQRTDLAILYACATDLRALMADATNRDRRNLQDAPEPHWHVLEPRLRPQAQAAHRYLTGPEAPGQPRGER